MGDNYNWRGGSGDFSDAGNWDDFTTGQSPATTPPGPSNSAVLGTDGSATVSGNGDVSTLSVDANIVLTGSVTAEVSVSFAFTSGTAGVMGGVVLGKQGIVIDGGAVDVTQSGTLEGGEALSNFGTLSIDNGTVTADNVADSGALLLTDGQISVTDALAVSDPNSGAASLDIGSGGTVSDHYGEVGIPLGGGSTADVHDGGSWQNAGTLMVGLESAGTLDITGGSTVSAVGGSVAAGLEALVLGLGVTGYDGTGIIDIDGAGSLLNITGDALLGSGIATGTLSLTDDGAMDMSGTLVAAFGTASLNGTASIAVGSGAVLQVGGDATLGASGAATVTVGAGGSLAVTGAVDIGASQGAGGTVSVVGTLSDGGDLTVGDTGTGSLDVNGGSLELTTGTIVIAKTAGSTGDMSVENAQIATTGDIVVGQAGTATLSVNQGGGIAAVTLSIGSAYDGNGQLVLDGAGSTADVNALTVGGDGIGALQVSGKALLSSTGNAALASAGTGVQQSATIDTKGSLLVTGELDVGKAGNALLTVDTGGLVTAAALVVGGSSSAVGTLLVSGSSGATASTVQYGTLLEIAKAGSGSLSIGQGATVEAAATHSGTVEIGVSATASGSIVLSGSGSELDAALLAVGGGKSAGGTGLLTIGSGAVVSAAATTVWQDGLVTLAGGTLLASGSVTDEGTMSGYGTIAGPLIDDGAVTASGGTLLVQGMASGTGELTVSGATLELQSGIAAGPTISFAGGAVSIDTPGAAGATFADFGAGDTIVLDGVIADSGAFADGALTLENGDAPQAVLAFTGSYDSGDFVVTPLGDQTVVTAAPCFAAGTRIATERGPVAVEALRIGDKVPLINGGHAPVVWLGRRRIDCRRHPRPQDVWPVRVAAHAFGPGCPHRELLLSPDHAVFTDGVLIPVRYLLNAATVRQEAASAVTYWHVELPAHGVLLAEGLPCESYLDTGNRGAFANGGAATALHPDFALATWQAKGCAPLVRDGAALHAVRRRLLARAERLGHVLTDDPALHLDADGERLWPIAIEGECHRFALRRRVAMLRLRSRCAVPAEIGVAEADHRRLGVMVTRLAAFRPWQWHDIPLAALPEGAGFHPLEATVRQCWRWTDGDARLVLPPACAEGGALLLDVQVAAVQRAWRNAASACAKLDIA